MSKAIRYTPKGMWKSEGFPFHQAVIEPEGRRVHLTGQVAWDADRNIIGGQDAGAQTTAALDNIRRILSEIGGTMDDIMSTTVYYIDQDDLPAIYEARKQALAMEHGPATTAVRVSSLVDPDLLIEITVIAVVPEDRYKDPT